MFSRMSLRYVCPELEDASLAVSRLAAGGPGLWNSLPPHLRDADLPYSRFRRSLKTFFVWMVGPWHSVNYFN